MAKSPDKPRDPAKHSAEFDIPVLEIDLATATKLLGEDVPLRMAA